MLTTNRLLRFFRNRGQEHSKLLIIGSESEATAAVKEFRDHNFHGYQIAGILLDNGRHRPARISKYPVLGLAQSLPQMVFNFPVDEVLCLSLGTAQICQEVIKVCEKVGITVHIPSNYYTDKLIENTKYHPAYFAHLNGTKLITLKTIPTKNVQLIFKELLDFTIALIFLILILPVMAVIALLIKLASRGPVFFVQERIGLYGRRFKFYKFRTMIQGADDLKPQLEKFNEASGPVFKIKNDPRLTSLGRFLRKFSLDELPQLFNVLKGEMSLVGPRPPIQKEVEKYQPWQRRRLSMKPGLTCIWQVSGRSQLGFETWMSMDLEYIDNWSLWLDLKILLKTIPAVLFCRGAY
jgi:exopolysaccharide biosynthesis polyprenyl glycosylphosphotransferase